MRRKAGYRILETEDLIEGVTLAEVNTVLSQEQPQNNFIVDTRPTVIDSRSPGYDSEIMFYAGDRVSRKQDIETILSDYFKQEDISLNYTGRGPEHRYYHLVNL